MQGTDIPSWDRGAIPGDDISMTIGAIFFSLPAAACGALLLSLNNGLGFGEWLALYAAIGTLMVLAVTIVPTSQRG